MFPVCTGINRLANSDLFPPTDVPCMHRDKPEAADHGVGTVICSLYAQG